MSRNYLKVAFFAFEMSLLSQLRKYISDVYNYIYSPTRVILHKFHFLFVSHLRL